MIWTLPLLALTLAPIDFDSKVMALGPLLEKLSAETGSNLKASPRLAQEIVFIQAKDVTLEDLKTHLAQAVDGEWSKKSDAEYLERGSALDRDIWKRHIALRRGYLEEELARLRKELQEPFDAKALARGLSTLGSSRDFVNDRQAAMQNAQKERTLFAKGPAARFINRLILACNPDDLAAVGPYSRVLFTATPTRMQRGFDAKRFKEAVAQFVKEQGDWMTAATSADFPKDPGGRMVSDPRHQASFDKPEELFQALEIRRSDAAGLFYANLIAADPNMGRQILSQSSLADPSRKYLNSVGEGKPADANDPEVKLDPTSESFKSLLQASFMGGKAEPRTEALQELLLRPDKFEPLSFGTSEILASYGKNKKLNVVASVPDSMLGAVWFSSREGSVRLFQSMTSIVQGGNMSLVEKDGWATLTPADRYEAATSFTPRATATALMKAVSTKGSLDIRDYATYAFNTGRISRMGVGEIYLALYDRSIMSTLDRTDWDCLRLYGSFNDTQRKGLEEGGKYPMGGLTAAQKAIVERIAYANEIRSEKQMGEGSAMLNGPSIEPTEAFPNGLPPDGSVNARVQKVPVLVAYGKSADGKVKPLRSINVWTLATVEDFKGDPAKMATYGVSGLTGYAPGGEKMIALRVELSPKVWKEMPITVPDHDPNATPVPWDKLPDTYVQQIRAAIESLKNQKANQPGRTIPPR